MPRTKQNPTTSGVEKPEVEETKTNEVKTPVINDGAEETKTNVIKKLNAISDDAEVVIVSKTRAGKKITGNTSKIITFDEKGKATVSGYEAKYLVGSGLGFELDK